MGTIRRTRDHPRRQEGSAFRTRDRRVRPLQTKNQNVALQPTPDVTHEYEIDSPSKRPAASVPLSTRDPPVSILTPRSLTEVIPYEGGLQPTIRVDLGSLAIRSSCHPERAKRVEGARIEYRESSIEHRASRIQNRASSTVRPYLTFSIKTTCDGRELSPFAGLRLV